MLADLAVITNLDSKQRLTFFDTATLKPGWTLQFAGNEQVGDYWWVNNERVVTGGGTAPSALVTQLRTAGLALDVMNVSNVGEHAGVWE